MSVQVLRFYQLKVVPWLLRFLQGQVEPSNSVLGPLEGSGSSARETVVSDEAILSPAEAQATCGCSQNDTDKGMDMPKQELFQLNLNSIITRKVG